MRKEELGRVKGEASLMEAFSFHYTSGYIIRRSVLFAKNLKKFEKRWVKPSKNGEISGRVKVYIWSN